MSNIKVKKAEWFPGTDAEWDQLIGPAVQEGIIKKGDIGLYAVPEDVEETERVSDVFTSFIRDDGWQNRVASVGSIFRSIVVRDPMERRMANVLRAMVRLTPRRSPFLFKDVLKREGFEDIKVPNLSSVLVGAVPAVVMGRGAFGFVMEEIAGNWYMGDRGRMAGDIGTDATTLDGIIKGQHLPKTHAEVVKIAKGLGVDPDVLDIAWFADKKARVVQWFATKPNEATSGVVRATIVNWLAAARLGERFMPIDVSSENKMERYLELAVFALRARIHPRTVIPVIASIDWKSGTLFKNVVAYAEELALDGWSWKAAILCYMAANHDELHVDIKTLTSLVHLGNSYLLNSEKTLPEFMGAGHARELQHYYLQWGLDLHRSNAGSSSEAAARLGNSPSVAKEVADTVERLGAGEPEAEAVQGFIGIARSAEPNYGVQMTPSRKSVVEDFKKNCPELWREIERSGRYDIVGRVLELADPHCDKSAVSFMAFNMAMRALAEGEGIIGKDFGSSMTNAQYIAEGAEVLFGGQKMRMYEGNLRPVLETHLGEEFIALGQGKDFIPVSMLASLAAVRVK